MKVYTDSKCHERLCDVISFFDYDFEGREGAGGMEWRERGEGLRRGFEVMRK